MPKRKDGKQFTLIDEYTLYSYIYLENEEGEPPSGITYTEEELGWVDVTVKECHINTSDGLPF